MGKVAKLVDRPPKATACTRTPPSREFFMLSTSRLVWGVLDHARERRWIATISGDAGTSKTTTARRYTAEHGGVVYVRAGMTVRAMQPVLVEIITAVLDAERCPVTRGFPMQTNLEFSSLEDELRKSRSNIGFLERALRPCLRRSVELLILDEVSACANDALEMIRDLKDRTGIGVVLLGNATFPTRFDGRAGQARFAQLTSRIARREHLSGLLPEDWESYFDHHQVRGRRARDLICRHAQREGHLRTAAFILDEAREKTPEGPLDLPEIAAAIDVLFGGGLPQA